MANECWQAKDDLVLLLYTALAGWCAVEAVRGRRRWWLGAAWFLGHAAGVKFTAGFAAGGLVAAALAARARPPALALPLFAAGISGWLAESWLFFGNPVHPFLSGVFPDTAWNPAYARAATRAMDAISPASIRTAADWLAGGWRAWGDPLMGSPALLALAPAGLLLLRGGAALFLRWWLLAAYALWVPTDRIARYLFPLVPALAAFAGAAAAAAPARARAVLVVAMLFALAGAGEFALPQGWRYLAGQVSREEYLAQRFTTWEDARRWLNGRTTPHDGLLLTGEDRRLWFRARVPATLFVAEPIPWRLSRDSRTPEEMRKRFRQRGLTWWLHNFVQAEFRSLSWAPGPEWDDRQLAVYAGFARRYLEPVRSPPRIDYDNGGFQVYRIARRPSPRDYPLWFLPTTEGTFHEAHRLFADLRFLEARMEADRQAARLPPAGEVQLLHAKVLSAAGDVAGVVRILEPLNRSGFIGDANFKLLAAAAAQQDRIELALDQYARQWQVARDDGLLPPVGWCLYKLGQVHAARGEAARAARDFEQAERCAPAAAAIPYELARALRDTGRIPAARRAIARALALAPADPTIRSLAGELEPR